MSPRTQHTNRPSNYVFKMAAFNFKWMRKISKKLCYKHWTYRKSLKLKKLPFKQYIINASSLFLFQIHASNLLQQEWTVHLALSVFMCIYGCGMNKKRYQIGKFNLTHVTCNCNL